MRIPQRALFIANGIGAENGKPGISGGDIRWIEIAKKWQEMGIEIHVLTQDAGIELCKRVGLTAEFHRMKMPSEYSIRGYLLRALNSFRIPQELMRFEGIIYASTEHWYDVIPGALIKRKNPQNRFAIVAHWVAPLIRKGTSAINSILFYINQRVGYFVGKRYSDVFLAVSKPTGNDLKRIGIPESKIRVVEAGVDYERIRQISSKIKEKQFDGVFMKRFDGTKGVFDVVEIWEHVVSEIPDAKLILIGHGTKTNVNKLERMIKDKKLEENVKILGPIYDFEEKFKTLAKSKVFLLPSYEENWAIVIGEAMAAGLPVVCYDLPEIRPIWKDNVIWIPRGNKKEFAKKVVELLENENVGKRVGENGARFVKRYDWRKIAGKELMIIQRGV
ncbi:glycosyltransferase, family 4 [Thermococcus kodakarensis KOD1]|uniref:Glycosyltransferase, family 4 n=1 Tax=Thermococcus kodakarensis (strain ATCC BAA-918 / JCM 12380 / KOD1) TaxID=69014 RepID=Q5JJ21_THEKO|nr:glycosyltransferase family 4 protein [Thermococcus kodakarensis]WCN27640.1 glycosyltransferase family 4 protein [Thermococcus kodakarensis]WCN29931.1 glycosyltransferase family 4 protein [Thermococcus kodakarensis]BAD85912.1 glycosyltransferase, family 4 [Thermococcus kodakarensis KOD1]